MVYAGRLINKERFGEGWEQRYYIIEKSTYFRLKMFRYLNVQIFIHVLSYVTYKKHKHFRRKGFPFQ